MEKYVQSFDEYVNEQQEIMEASKTRAERNKEILPKKVTTDQMYDLEAFYRENAKLSDDKFAKKLKEFVKK